MPFDLREEVRLLAAAAQFLTRLPFPEVTYRPDWLPRSAKFFPLVGILIGAMAAATLVVGRHLWPSPLPEILAVGAALLVTGALHEDGLADTADSLGGRTREARLAIMKDPRTGTYGILALLVSTALKVAALAALTTGLAAASLVAAHALGRVAAVLTMAWQTYAGDRAAAKVEHAGDRPRPSEMALAALFGLMPLLAIPLDRAATALILGALVSGLVIVRTCRALGGYTGDVLGAGIAVFETAFLLGAALTLARP